ncbi:hypothetical protein AEA42_16170 [Shewanella sp. Sh95]|uniref:DUF6626 family protein n=1 Tax=Shewanella sp. Sh95 TaxID=1689868 RepID=UPI0006DBD572|nr:DUF6626 family protein [Shewanella sp. Sh95]KPN75999.1 hypothetical protein AEA42_16170 [Shewanella sp. Sh95]
MQLQDVYAQLKSMNLCKSKYQFSSEFLGMSKGYYSSVVLTRNDKPSICVLSILEYTLKVLASANNGSKNMIAFGSQNKLLWLAEQVRFLIDENCRSRKRKVYSF